MKTSKKIVCSIVSCSFCLLVGCGASEVYRDDNIVASLDDSVDGRLDLSINLRISSTSLDESLLQTIETFPRSKDLNIPLSDGTIYGYDGTVSEEISGVNWKVYSSTDEIENDLNMEIVTSTDIKYPEENNNILLMYNPDGYYISAFSASAITDYCEVTDIRLMISFESTNSYTARSIIDVSENIRHEELETYTGKPVDVFIDEEKEKAGIYLLEPGFLYNWQLNGIQSFDEVISFVNSLE